MSEHHNLKAKFLLKRYLEGNCTEEEKSRIEEWYLALNDKPNELSEKEIISDLLELQQRLADIPRPAKIRKIPYLKIAAAIILISLSVGILWKSNQPNEQKVIAYQDVQPGRNRATLSLNGKNTIVLNGQKNGLITKDNSITYNDGSSIETIGTVQMATLTTPIAGQYQATLPDGTHVWLNASSSITYPTAFDHDKRVVSISGEAYFEVTKDPKRPFIVNTAQQKIEVLGTTFNINAYGDDGKVLTTLSTGSLRVVHAKSGNNVVISPGQQAVVSDASEIEVKKVDSEEASSWTRGIYIVNNETLENYAKQIERWYDVKVEIGPYENIRLSAIISRNAKLSEVLQAIELKTRLKFKIEGRRVTIIK